ncbi:hypothetical protein Taro_013935 [Colocasia esculenta]|uniref:Uncharacterized protein n=1 Tax=Colocasia esculenta TaxID=4460 RepID=A0A843UK74_COLES|nr:hypothetical protein [Colocasia esculenta]
MPILACILPVVTFLCQPVLGAVETCVGNQAQRFLAYLTNRADGVFADPANAAEEVPESASEVVGVEDTLSVIRNHLNDDSVGVIGIHGMGGVGKTTIVQRINNKFYESGRRCSFDLVIWVTVSQAVNIPAIQKQIADRLSLSLSDSSTTEENARVLFKALSDKRFLVLLDDMWEAIDLQVKIGIPRPKGPRRNSKIAFTTRSLQVCSDMGADKMVLVKPLDNADSWKLFCSKLSTGEVIRKNPTIRLLAEQVVHKCGGLPLALITVGKAMANRELIQDWEYAVNALDRCAERLEGMDDRVLGCLKFSYDYLKDDNMRSALLFCAMYPEDADISTAELINYWVGEGLVDDENNAGEGSIDDARGAGQALISKLRDACLLESGTESSTVRMHDAVRDMALWINRVECNKVDGFLAYHSSTPTNAVTRTKGRGHIKRIWVRGSDLEMLYPDVILSCSSNRILMLTHVRGFGPSILQGIASFMQSTLRVLDLSFCNALMELELPGEVGLMAELRFLALSFTRIRSLPKELGNLIKLRQLLLNSMYYLREIPREAIAGLGSLQVLDMWDTAYDWEADGRGEDGTGRQLEVGDLEADVPRLEELHIQLGSRGALERFLMSNKLRWCTRRLNLEKRKGVGHIAQSEDPLYGEGGSLSRRVFSSLGRSLKRLHLCGEDAHPWEGGLRISLDQLPLLEELGFFSIRWERMPEMVLVGTTNPTSVNVRLSAFAMWSCDGLKVLKLEGTFPCLQEIHLENCSTMEELALEAGIGEGLTQDDAGLLDCHFPMLREIYLNKLPALKSMGNRPLRLPALTSIGVFGCPELRRIPLDAAGVPMLERIGAEQEWWDTVEFAGGGGHDTKPVLEKLFLAGQDW